MTKNEKKINWVSTFNRLKSYDPTIFKAVAPQKEDEDDHPQQEEAAASSRKRRRTPSSGM